MTNSSNSSLPPRPKSISQMPRMPSVETDFWAALFLDLSVRVEWLEQAIDAVPKEDASASALVRLKSYQRALHDLRESLSRVQSHRPDPHLKPLFALEGPLAGFLSRLYAWCDEIGDDFERMAVALRRREPTSIVFSHRAVNDSYARFNTIIDAMRKANDVAHEKHGTKDKEAWRAFDEHLEELIWSTEWVHMTLARGPGD